MAIYVKITGKTQGVIKGAVMAASFADQIQINTLEFGVGSPSDVATGMPTGRRVARPVRITRPMDKASPLLHMACVTNETLTTLQFSYVKEGEGHKAFATLTLTNGLIRDFSNDGSYDGGSVETISFTYQKIEFTWVEGGITSVDDWSAA